MALTFNEKTEASLNGVVAPHHLKQLENFVVSEIEMISRSFLSLQSSVSRGEWESKWKSSLKWLKNHLLSRAETLGYISLWIKHVRL